jgi:radical SAM superfamily enzyme YgiQ (UPF0313 family)
MRFLLLNSPVYREKSETSENYLPPLGLGYIATHLVNAGIDTKIVDCIKEHLGITEIYELLNMQKPEYIGINAFTQNLETVREIIEKYSDKATFVIGGQVVKSVYESVLKWITPNPLIAVIGESELILPEIVLGKCKEQPIACAGNISVYRVDKDSIYYPKDLKSVLLDRRVLKDEIITNQYGQKEAAIVTSRGCMYNCEFCGGARDLNRDITTRFKEISDIKKEIAEIISVYPEVTSIRVLDDLFLRDKYSIEKSIELFHSFPGITWRGMAHIYTFINNIGLLPLLREAGCRELFIGIESGSDKIRNKINKLGSREEVIQVILSILQAGIDVKGYFMYGFPNETSMQAEETYSLAEKLISFAKSTKGNFRTSVFEFRPYHGTKLYNEIIASGRTIGEYKQNEGLDNSIGRSQFNFKSGNYSSIEDAELNNFIINTQNLSEVSYA